MMTKTSKKYIAALAGLLILLYHCWIPVFKYGTVVGSVERFIVAGSFVGVDLFFFISAYSLAARPVGRNEYPGFLLNRAVKILPLFIIALFLGQFLWFLPAIMIVYVVFPPLYGVCARRPALSFLLLIAGWAGLTGLVLGVLKPAQDWGIFLFRIPVIILGAYMGSGNLLDPRRNDVFIRDSDGALVPKQDRRKAIAEIVLGALLLVAGVWLVYEYAYLSRLDRPFRGTFYLVGIPEMLGMVLVINGIAGAVESAAGWAEPGLAESGRGKTNIIAYFGSMTLELYFFQMVLGSFLVNEFYKVFGSRILTNLAVMAVVIAASVVLHILLEIPGKMTRGKKNGRPYTDSKQQS